MVWKCATAGNFFGWSAITADNTAAITKDTNNTTVLPVGFTIVI